MNQEEEALTRKNIAGEQRIPPPRHNYTHADLRNANPSIMSADPIQQERPKEKQPTDEKLSNDLFNFSSGPPSSSTSVTATLCSVKVHQRAIHYSPGL
jgi:hypothetical protein